LLRLTRDLAYQRGRRQLSSQAHAQVRADRALAAHVPYHAHRYASGVVLVGHMSPGQPYFDGCPPDCPLPKAG